MGKHDGNQGGRPTLLTADLIEPIVEAIRVGCYVSVAAGRVGVSGFALTLWDQRGKRESEAREERCLRGEPADEPASLYEQLHVALDQAKSEARYSAETRVFKAMPMHWLTKGYARKDWHDSHQLVRGMVDELVQYIYTRERYTAFLTAGDPPRPPDSPPPAPPPTPEEQEHDELMHLANPTSAEDRADMRQHVARCPICRANAVTGTVEWTDRRWAAVLGPIVPARPDGDDIAEFERLDERRRAIQRQDQEGGTRDVNE